jgi:hypothetical protein
MTGVWEIKLHKTIYYQYSLPLSWRVGSGTNRCLCTLGAQTRAEDRGDILERRLCAWPYHLLAIARVLLLRATFAVYSLGVKLFVGDVAMRTAYYFR